eukprot:c39625_g1_i1 orf=2-199(-)
MPHHCICDLYVCKCFENRDNKERASKHLNCGHIAVLYIIHFTYISFTFCVAISEWEQEWLSLWNTF